MIFLSKNVIIILYKAICLFIYMLPSNITNKIGGYRMKKLTVKKDNPCMACLSCVIACSNAYYKVGDPGKSCIQIIERNGAPKPMVCVQCGKCASVCEAGAITQNPKGVYMVNRKLCTGCGKCAEACPAEAINEGTPYAIDPAKCVDFGACAAQCPAEAISAA